MFCNHCGSLNPDDAKYCNKCGHAVVRPPVPQQPKIPNVESFPPDDQPTQKSVGDIGNEFSDTYSNMLDDELLHLTEAKESLTDIARDALAAELRKRRPSLRSSEVESSGLPSPAALARKGVRGPYIWLTIYLVGVTSFLAAALFNIGLQSMAGEAERADGTIGRTLFGLIFVLYIARRTWKSLLKQEPETHPGFKQKHRRFQVIAGTCIVVILTSAFSFGMFFVGPRIEKNTRLKALVGKLTEQAPKGVQFRQDLLAIRSAETPTMEDYYAQCLALETLLDEAEPHQKESLALLNSVFALIADNEELAPTVELIRRIIELDSQGVDELRREIAAAKELWSLPYGRQEAFYEREIVPIQSEIERLAAEEATLAREAQKQGITLPSDISEFLNEVSK